MLTIENAIELQLSNIWLETDSLPIVKAYHHYEGTPWRMQTKWMNCMRFGRQIRSKFSHV